MVVVVVVGRKVRKWKNIYTWVASQQHTGAHTHTHMPQRDGEVTLRRKQISKTIKDAPVNKKFTPGAFRTLRFSDVTSD